MKAQITMPYFIFNEGNDKIQFMFRSFSMSTIIFLNQLSLLTIFYEERDTTYQLKHIMISRAHIHGLPRC